LGILLACLGAVMAGCSTPNKFRVDSLARSDAAPLAGTYRILGAPNARGEPPPYFEEVANHLRAVLNARGMVEAWGTNRPDVEIVVDYGVGPPRQITRETMDMLYGMGSMAPVYGRTTKDVRPSSVYLPTQTSNSRRFETKTYFETHLTVVGRQPESQRRDAEMREVWRVEVTTTDRDAAVDKLVPLMVAAANQYLGTNSAGREEIKVTAASVLAPEPGLAAGER